MNKTIIIAHRGASGLVQFENTIESFTRAVEVGAAMIEFDIRKTHDNKIIVYHDPHIAGLNLKEKSYKEINKQANKDGFNIPLLSEVVNTFKNKIKFDIELKETGYEEEIIKIVQNQLKYDQYIIKSFITKSIKKIKIIDPHIRTALLVGENEKSIISILCDLFPEIRLLNTKADFISPNYRLLTFGFTTRMKLLGREMLVWTVDNPKTMKKLFTRKIYGLITNRPDIAVKILEKKK